MADSATKLLEGVFAIKKPPHLSSAQVIRDAQNAFTNSKTFRPLIEVTRNVQEQNRGRNGNKRRKLDNAFKIGHGGTLDPMATGVLIVGVGRGTKLLQNFLDCTKTYETVVLFGKSTDTYDVAGKIVATASAENLSKEMVEEKLEAFRGSIQQVPPIYSALKIDGMKAYDYARTGKELPRELAARKMTVSECVLTQWYPAGEHEFRWPAEEAAQAEKDLVQSLETEKKSASESNQHQTLESTSPSINEAKPKPDSRSSSGRDRSKSPMEKLNSLSKEEKAKLHTHEFLLDKEPANTPAVRVRLTVSSGFYVRSFAHDLGIACGSHGTMAELARTRQADFSTSDPAPDGLIPALDYEDLARGEEVWGPKISKVLEDWVAKNPAPHISHHQRQQRQVGSSDVRNYSTRKRRNSSSPELS